MSNFIYKNLVWSEDVNHLVGLKREVYYIPRRDIVLWPARGANVVSAMGEVATYDGDFVLAALAKWKKLSVVIDKSPVDGKSQGTSPRKTFLNSVILQHESVNEDASALSMQANNDELVWLLPTKSGRYRVVGNDDWNADVMVDQKLGASVTDEASTTLTITVIDVAPGLFYEGKIATEAVVIDLTTLSFSFNDGELWLALPDAADINMFKINSDGHLTVTANDNATVNKFTTNPEGKLILTY